MKRAPLLALLLIGCINFRQDFDDYCRATGRCDGGTAGGSAAGGGGGAFGGGSGGSSGGSQACAAELCQLEAVVTKDNLFTVWGSSANDVWVGGDALWHYTNGALAEAPNPATYRIFALGGSGPNDVWNGGNDVPFLWHRDSSGMWRSKLTDAGSNVNAFYAVSDTEQYMVLEDALYRWQGGSSNWENIWLNDAGVYFDAVASAPGAPLWLAGKEHLWRYDGNTFTHEDAGTDGEYIQWIHVAPDTSVWAVGTLGTVLRRKASTNTWEKITVDVPGHLTEDLWSVWSRSEGDAFIVGERGALLHWRADAGFSKLDAVALDGGNGDVLWFSVWGAGTELWTAGGKTFIDLGVFDAGVMAHFKIGY